MSKEVPQANILIKAFKERVVQRKGRPILETLAAGEQRATYAAR